MNRWSILALLFLARSVMAMQYQVSGAISPALEAHFAIGITEIGVLIGLYMAPGLVIALPGSAISARFGEKRVVGLSLLLMGLGAAVMAFTPHWEMFLAGHLLAGIGGILINVLMTKMVADWFAGAEITTALAIFINSWPFGIALALVLFPPLVAAFDIAAAYGCLAVLAVSMGGLIFALYAPPPDIKENMSHGCWPRGAALTAVLAAGLCWGAFNGGLAILFGFGTTLLVSHGVDPAEAARNTSLILWVLALAAPLGGMVADRTGRAREMIFLGLTGLAGLSVLALDARLTLVMFAAFGAVAGLVAGPIMSLPARVLSPDHRVVGMGLFFTMYYVVFVFAPMLAGALADLSGTLNLAFWLAGALQFIALAALAVYTSTARAI